jgi:hypothetical protein
MKNFDQWLFESLQEDSQVKLQLVNVINRDINGLKTKNAKAIADASKIIDVNAIIDKARLYLINQVPTVMLGLKSGRGGDVFTSGFVGYITSIIKSELESVNFIKKSAAKVLAPDKAAFLARAGEFDEWPFISTLDSLLDMGMSVGWMEATKPYENQLWNWSKGSSNWLNKNAKKIKTDLVTLFSNFLYA